MMMTIQLMVTESDMKKTTSFMLVMFLAFSSVNAGGPSVSDILIKDGVSASSGISEWANIAAYFEEDLSQCNDGIDASIGKLSNCMVRFISCLALTVFSCCTVLPDIFRSINSAISDHKKSVQEGKEG